MQNRIGVTDVQNLCRSDTTVRCTVNVALLSTPDVICSAIDMFSLTLLLKAVYISSGTLYYTKVVLHELIQVSNSCPKSVNKYSFNTSKLDVVLSSTLRAKTVNWWHSTLISWLRHQMETISRLLAICAGNSPVNGEFPAQRPVTRSLDVFFDLRPNKRLSKQSSGWWFVTPSRPLWRHYSV